MHVIALAVLGVFTQCVQAQEMPYALSDKQRAIVAEHLPFGYPSTGELLFRSGYVVSHNNWLKIPNWAAYHVSSATVRLAIKRADDFRADPELRPWQRAELADYNKSGFDQGHMAPAASMRRGKTTMSESFLLSNMAPQVGVGFNRGIWRILEDKVRDWSLAKGQGWVFVGPVFKDVNNDGIMEFMQIGKNHVAVPTHNFMILIAENQSKELSSIAFVIPNEKVDAKSLHRYIVSVDEIQRLTGLDFLDRLPDVIENALESMPQSELWQ